MGLLASTPQSHPPVERLPGEERDIREATGFGGSAYSLRSAGRIYSLVSISQASLTAPAKDILAVCVKGPPGWVTSPL
jgi:hypothetical protein